VGKKQAGKNKENIVSEDKGVCVHQNVTYKAVPSSPDSDEKKAFSFPQTAR
jgi:hypothetical protein